MRTLEDYCNSIRRISPICPICNKHICLIGPHVVVREYNIIKYYHYNCMK